MTTIRFEQPGDIAAIHELVRQAFTGHPISQGAEPFIVDALRADGALELSQVADVDGEPVGHIAYSAATIGAAETGWFLVGPVAVRPDLQGRGIGRELIEASLEIMQSRDADGCVLVGDPDFYHRFGFRRVAGVEWPGVPGEYVLTLAFGHEEPVGEIGFHPAFLLPGPAQT